MVLHRPAAVETRPLALENLPAPKAREGEVVLDVHVCGVCRTDLHIVEGELPRITDRIVPGHQVVGRVAEVGTGVSRFREGDRVGVAWLHQTCGGCPYCLDGRENLCRSPVFTGHHVDGGYAERTRAPAEFAYAIPDTFSDAEAAPLLCAGIIGYRALLRSGIRPGGRLGLYGFGASAHIAIQVARYWGCKVYVSTRGKEARQLALGRGADWAGEASMTPPEPLDAAILFAPAGELVPVALRALRPGGTLACAGIYLTDIPTLRYETDLFEERVLTSVTANTREDGVEFLRIAAEIPIRPETTPFQLEEANEALLALKRGEFSGAAVLNVAG